ncbi:hypothetical protein O6H91_07G039500 [Diphasiastrum complanatum]|uniref:Uncharacterized protein n=1 Tax=Diphasiastrum complanatum TaxID=34168 RepID=A0ACC2D487_DIPCM|nr:hypothetical protein O6H91_07G039500 [Diphasiastrum complanatum]
MRPLSFQWSALSPISYGPPVPAHWPVLWPVSLPVHRWLVYCLYLSLRPLYSLLSALLPSPMTHSTLCLSGHPLPYRSLQFLRCLALPSLAPSSDLRSACESLSHDALPATRYLTCSFFSTPTFACV